MKITVQPCRRTNEQGSALVIALVLCALMVTLAGSFLYLSASEVTAVSRSQTWNSAMVVAEAGMEEGMSMINRYAYSGTSVSSWPSATANCGWSTAGNNVYFLRRDLGSNGYYTVYITNQNNSPIIKATGYAYFPVKNTYLARSIMIQGSGSSFFLGAILAKGNIVINGSATIDSYNSQDPRYSTGGQWDINKRKDGGNVGSIESNVVAAVSEEGSANVYGKLATGPNSTISMQGNASAGSLAWVNGKNKGVQSGWSRNDLNVSIPDAPPLPAQSYLSLSSGSALLSGMGGTAYYRANSTLQLTSKDNLLITNGTVYIDATQGIKMDGQATITIAPNSRLILYLGTENSQLDGGGVINGSGFATNCIVYGKNNCPQIEINGNSAFVGYVYAPYADITLNGNADFSGAMVGDTFQINGNMDIHYDESLGGQNDSTIYRMSNWVEVPAG
ncbi:MAG TPA: collagen-binding domain-containing protein [Verrucomicrobiae bacterium]